MPQSTFLATLIVTLVAVREDPKLTQATFQTATGKIFIFSTIDRGLVGLRIARSAVQEGKPVAVRFNRDTRVVSAAYWPTRDTVISITDDPQSRDRVNVALKMRPSLTALSRSGADFTALLKLLRQSQESSSELLLAIDPATSIIEAAIAGMPGR